MKKRKAWISGALIWLLWSVHAFGQQPLTSFISEGELRQYVDLWSKAREAYYGNLYGKRFSIGVERDASQFLVGRYAVAKLSAEFLKTERSIARAVIQTDMEVVLNRSLAVAVRRVHGGIAVFIVKPEVTIIGGDVQRALQEENCNVIPCPPDKCDPDTCTKRSFGRFGPPVQ